MTALLTDNLPLLAGAPNGIQKLRELILELAVRGKLVPQDPSDEPASELLKRIAEEKARLVAEGRIRKQKLLAQIGEDEKPFELPEGWGWQRFGEIFSLEYGDNLPADKRSNTGEYPVYGSNGVVGTHSVCFVESPCIVVGRKGSAGALNLCLSSGCCVTDVAYYCVPPSGCSLDYVFKLFHTLGLDSLGKGIKPGLNRNEAYELVVAIPPLAEQHRIVARVDELMALCDRLEARQADAESAHARLVQALLDCLTQASDAADFATNWQRLAEHFHSLFTSESSIDALKQTLLQLAVMGKLVLQDPRDEPASELLKRIAEEKERLVAEGKIKKQKPLAEIGEQEKPFVVPDNWVWSRIGELAISTDYGLSEKTSDLADGVPVLKMGDIQGGQVVLGGQMSVDRATEGLPDLYLDSEDLLYNRTNSAELVGKTGIFLGCSGEFTFASYLIRIRCPKNLLSPAYLNVSMNAPGFREFQINPHLKQQCGQANVNGTIMKNMLVSVPPVAEQHRIVAKLDQLLSLCDQLKARLSATRQLHERLASTLVEQAVA